MHREMIEMHKEMYEMLKSFQYRNKFSAQEQDNLKGKWSRPSSPIICFSCDEEGHVSNRCPNRKNTDRKPWKKEYRNLTDRQSPVAGSFGKTEELLKDKERF
ncbi:hypothetical protein DPMN_012343 [Dreissena polymorpha]|uniref:CCHC-type domain-containing protein n=1 Tax=Dreissena polymorpha TaxID=45954 RepID=A0A9D4N5N5_DREPO|nr:hypothetical protein DPMN_012343 [Dreissena polymorpha]